MRIAFFGPPGSGKGTQAGRISERFGMQHISTGIILRKEVRRSTELGRRIREIVRSGRLVDDETVNAEVFGRIRGVRDFLMDGYPRNRFQAESLDRFLDGLGRPLTGAVFLEVPDEEVMRRIAGRRTCPGCGRTEQSDDSGEEMVCGRCDREMVVREDDLPEVTARRLSHYHEVTRPLESYYEGRRLRVDGTGTRDEVTDRLVRELSRWE